MDDLIRRQAALDAIMGQPPEPHYPSWYAAQIEKIPAVQPATNCSEIPNGSDDTISRRAAIDMLDEQIELCNKALCAFDISLKDEYAVKVEKASLKAYKEQLENMPSVQPETAAVTIGRTKGGVVMWYECDACGESIDQKDCYCRNCGRKLTLPDPYRGGEK